MTFERVQAAAVDKAAAALMWSDYAAAQPEAVRLCPDYTVEHFGDSAALADQLLHAVTHGLKRATSELAAEYLAAGESIPRVGSHWIACDGAGVPTVVLRSIELRLGDFASADAAFAYDEGEDDRSLERWRTEHRRYWQRGCAARGAKWRQDEEIVFERFTVVWPPEYADA
ncbi:ASCH domain-containing protein [Paeniglutamicibacter cryotolerans]|uniref:Uncharacterized protein YhfF n=1 Tax=Paeniglutamicibacter cryotolerans TaxID=670079 RepID=A0A839QEU6_9MICC|nr:ASCH domain-containing protein [Paeniglutamicibacter cryotolerans]MBB2994157.1 uncharacterized protein YhfF [Paeniglutamicibacter cryotolerans]